MPRARRSSPGAERGYGAVGAGRSSERASQMEQNETSQPGVVSQSGAGSVNTRQETADNDGLLKSSGVTGSMTLVSRVLGLARDIVIARMFGVGDGVDAFFLANKIPNFMRRLFAEGAFNQAFVPVLSEYRSRRSHAEVRDLVNAVAASLGGLLAAITALVVAAAPLLAAVVAYGFLDEPQKFATFVQMLRITFPYLLLISMTALCGAVLNSYGRFAVPAITPAMLNLSLIGCSLLLAPHLTEPALALAWGVLIAGFAQLLFQLPFLARIQLLPVPRPRRGHDGVRRIRRLMLPALFGVSVSQINLLFRYLYRLAAGQRQRVLAVLLRPADGVSPWHIRHCHRHRGAAEPVAQTRRSVHGRFCRHPRLGLPAGLPDRVAGDPRAGPDFRTLARYLVPE